METVKINLNQTEKIKKFIQVARSFESDIDVFTQTSHIDGKSIMGLFTIDLSNNTYAKIISNNPEECNAFVEKMKEFM